MFAVIYRATIKTGSEENYKKAWQVVAEYFIKCQGAFGSCLHKSENGVWVAYSRWPDRQTRDASWGDHVDQSAFPPEIIHAVQVIKDCIEEHYPDICMDVECDLLR